MYRKGAMVRSERIWTFPDTLGRLAKCRLIFSGCLIFALTSCMTVVTRQAGPDVYVVRHLHTPKDVKDPDLTPLGRDYALRLRDWLAQKPPTAIFVSNTKRAKQTAAPTAERYRVIPIVYDPSDTKGLLASIRQQRGTVLVVGHSNTVPDIVAGLGGERPTPLSHEDFGEVWYLRGENETWSRTRL